MILRHRLKINYTYASRCVSAHFPDAVNEKQLKKQKMRLTLVKACRVLIGCQDYLRQILSQPIAAELLAATSAAEGGVQQPAEGEEGTSAQQLDTSGSGGPTMLMQMLMSAATQPSPIKAVFSRVELEVRPTAV